MQWGHRWLAVVWLAWALGSVVAIGAQEAPPAPAAPAPAAPAPAPPPAEPPPPAAEAPPPAPTPPGTTVRQPPEPQPGDNLITMDFQDVDLPVLVKFVSEITGRNFILDERVKGKVTIISPSKITVDEAYAVFQSVLQVKGFTTVPAGSVIKIVQAQEAKSSTVETFLPGRRAAETDEFITKLMPLTNVDANNILPIIQPLISANGLLAAYAATNTLILIDSAANVARLSQIIHELDVEGIERDVEVVRLNYAYAPELAAVLAQVLEEQSTPGVVTAPTAPGAPRPPGSRRGAQAPAAAPQTAQGGTGEKAFKIIPEERTNSLIVVAGPMLMRRIRELIVRLDVPIPAGTERVNVYYLKYASAFEIVPVLSDLIGASGGGIGGLTGGLLASRLTGTTASRGGRLGQRGLGFAESVGGAGLDLLGASGRSGFGSRAQAGRFGLGGAGGGRGVGVGVGQGGAAGGVQTITGGGGSQFEGDVRVTADPSINALIIYASPHDYETLKRVIELLDVRRRQVFVEAIILEVRVEKDRDLGIQLQGAVPLGDAGVGFGRFQSPNALDVLVDPSLLSGIGGLVLAAASNQTIRLPNGAVVPAQAALLTAAQADTNVNVLSAPNILTTDNQEAEIVVGQNVPFIASRSTSEANLSNQFATVDRRDVGITLRITPQISEGGMVRLDIFEEVSDLIRQPIAGLDPNVVGPSTTIRSATTAVVVRDGQTVVIGGLISDDIENAINKVPFFGDIPVLGNFFKRTSSNRIKTNLLIFLTPHIIRGSREHRTMSIEQRDRTRAFMADENFPNRRRGVLEAPSWDPPLPEDKRGEEETETGESAATQPSDLPRSSNGAPPVAAAANRFVLLASIIERGEPPTNLASDSGLLAVEIPTDSGLRTLFRAGERYRYSSDRFEGLYQCLEAYGTAQEAFLVYPEGLPVDPAKGEFLHWRRLDDAQSANVSAWTALN